MRRGLVLASVVLLAGCFGATPGPSEADDELDPTPRFAHLYPPQDGSIWPRDLEGPFDALPLEHVTVASFDGVILDGWLLRPDLPDGVLAPTLVYSSPYLGTELDSAQPDQFVRAGYAQVKFSVRGTGNSGGCLDFFGADEQADQAVLVEWAAAQPWSNGRVGFYGSSYRGTTTLEAAIQNPPSLKAAVAIAPVADLMTLFATPQGALWNELPAQLAAAFAAIAALPRALGDEPLGHATSSAEAVLRGDVGRLCPDVASAFARLQLEPAAKGRDVAFFAERDLRPGLANVRVPLMWTDGYYDDQYWQGAHAWKQVTGAPFEYIAGPWPHTTPTVPEGSFFDYMVVWFDFWLKGVGDVSPYLGSVLWQDTITPGISTARGDGAFHVSSAWPPSESVMTPYNLTERGLSTTAPGAIRAYRSVQVPEGMNAPVLGSGGAQWPKHFLCDDAADLAQPIRLAYRSDSSATPSLIAGIPVLDLVISSDQPGGLVNAFLLLQQVDEAPCGTGPGPALISFGTADLQFHDDIYNATAFPTGTPTLVRIELTDIAQVIGPQHELVLVLGAGNTVDHQTDHAPMITVHGGDAQTRLWLPVVASREA